MEEVLRLENISKLYQDENCETVAIKDFTYGFQKGDFVSIIGPSGCGKSTLLSIIAGLEKASSGKIFIGGVESSGVSDSIGYMLQKDYLLDWRTIQSNVMFGLEIKHMVTEESKAYVERLLKTYGLYEFKDKYPSQLSGGMRQRAALIRTLASNPDILLLDEAFSALDYQTRLSVTDDVYSIIKKEGKTAIMVTHDIPESISMSDKVIVLSHRPATIKKVYDIDFDLENRTPLNCRENPKFSTFFDCIWRELNK
ncbi:MAG: ABC transporter ATP-binding protein [Clostridia bacterium]|nr:ABC transporter ATP-binding protein [Clostridia bacterium]